MASMARRLLVVAGVGGGLVVWWRRRQSATGARTVPSPEDDRAVDEAIAESFPASDPPAYAGSRGGAHHAR